MAATDKTRPFELVSDFTPQGDQPKAIAELLAGLERGDREQVLLGITGSGKTFTVASVVTAVQRPTLVIAHNKTLAAQLYGEFKSLFPNNEVHYFVSYYDYYQPEAYVPASDTFIEKDTSINDDIDRLRHAATQALLSRRDVIIVASVSCIYGIGAVEFYREMMVDLYKGQTIDRDKLLRRLVDIQFTRNDYDFHRGTFRVRGDVVEIFPPHEEDRAIRIEFFGDQIERLVDVDPLRGVVLSERERAAIFPSSHYVTPETQRAKALVTIRDELQIRLAELNQDQRLVEAQRLEQRTMFDLEMLEQMGFCTGIENYSRHLAGRQAGAPPPTLLNYFPDDYLLVIDESHQTIPQLRAMYRGDQSRKGTLVTYGFRLPSALDNRPLRFEEFNERFRQVIYVSATPSDYELTQTGGVVVEQIIRPTGLLDPEIEVRPVENQVDNLLEELHQRIDSDQRVLVTTLTKRMAEDLSEYYRDLGIKVRYLHSDIDTLERVEILRELRSGTFDVLVGINLLREGLDLPEVSLVAILDADKEGFLRSEQALIQTIGRASRNVDGKVIMYADKVTPSMHRAIEATGSRRQRQAAFNASQGITPQTVKRPILNMAQTLSSSGDPSHAATDGTGQATTGTDADGNAITLSLADITATIEQHRKEMMAAAQELAFERAAQLRDQISRLRQTELLLRDPTTSTPHKGSKRNSTKRAGRSKGRMR